MGALFLSFNFCSSLSDALPVIENIMRAPQISIENPAGTFAIAIIFRFCLLKKYAKIVGMKYIIKNNGINIAYCIKVKLCNDVINCSILNFPLNGVAAIIGELMISK